MATPSVPPIMEEQAQADEPRTCRNCLSDENPQDLIAPCNVRIRLLDYEGVKRKKKSGHF